LLNYTGDGEQDRYVKDRRQFLTGSWRTRPVGSMAWKKPQCRLVNKERYRLVRIEFIDRAEGPRPTWFHWSARW